LNPNPVGGILARPLVAVAIVALVLGVLRFDYLFAEAPWWDEQIPLEAARLLESGASPYSHRYYNYPPPMVQAIAAVEALGATRALVLTWRAANLAAVVALAWLSAGWAGWRGQERTGVALVAALSPVVGHALAVGNLSPLFALPALVAFERERRAPWSSSLLLGASIAIKPLALGGAVFLAAHRLFAGPRRPAPVAALAWTAFAALLLAPGAALLPAMVSRMSEVYFDPHQLSIKRLLAGIGVEVASPWIAAAVIGAALASVGRRALAPSQILLVAPVVALAALPVVWAHSFVLTMPLQLAALARLRERWRCPTVARDGRWLGEVVGVVASLAAMHGAASPTLANDWPERIQWWICLAPAVAPACLLAYVLGTRRREAGAVAMG
jgi:hypothetical protein